MMQTPNKETKKGLKSDFSDFVIRWNFHYPIDFWWRKKYGVSFGSKKHRSMSHVDMLIDFVEGVELRRWKRSSRDKELQDTLASLGQPSNLNREVIRLSKKDIDDEFANLDISQFDNSTVKNVEKTATDERS